MRGLVFPHTLFYRHPHIKPRTDPRLIPLPFLFPTHSLALCLVSVLSAFVVRLNTCKVLIRIISCGSNLLADSQRPTLNSLTHIFVSQDKYDSTCTQDVGDTTCTRRVTRICKTNISIIQDPVCSRDQDIQHTGRNTENESLEIGRRSY
jgi:hypothetical protein